MEMRRCPLMEDLIILFVLAVILLFAVSAAVKRSRRKGCCGSADYQAKPRKLRTVAEKRVYRVEGMHCQHCVNRVVEAVQKIPEASAAVNLKKGLVTVSMEQPIEDSVILCAIEKAGYMAAPEN